MGRPFQGGPRVSGVTGRGEREGAVISLSGHLMRGLGFYVFRMQGDGVRVGFQIAQDDDNPTRIRVDVVVMARRPRFCP